MPLALLFSCSAKAWEHAKEVKKSSKDAAKIAEEVKVPVALAAELQQGRFETPVELRPGI